MSVKPVDPFCFHIPSLTFESPPPSSFQSERGGRAKWNTTASIGMRDSVTLFLNKLFSSAFCVNTKKRQKTHHMCTRSYFLVIQDLSLDPRVTGFKPFALPVLWMLWFSHTTRVWLMSCQCTLFLQVSPPSHLPPGLITREAVKHKPNQNTSRNTIGLFPSFNACSLTLRMAVNTVDSFKNVS